MRRRCHLFPNYVGDKKNIHLIIRSCDSKVNNIDQTTLRRHQSKIVVQNDIYLYLENNRSNEYFARIIEYFLS